MRHWLLSTVLLVAALASRSLSAQTSGPLNFAWKTLGAEQLWSDDLVYGHWRIQRNEITDHYRLLDPSDARRAWGTAAQCRAALAGLKRSEMLPPLDGRAVITLHGFGRS